MRIAVVMTPLPAPFHCTVPFGNVVHRPAKLPFIHPITLYFGRPSSSSSSVYESSSSDWALREEKLLCDELCAVLSGGAAVTRHFSSYGANLVRLLCNKMSTISAKVHRSRNTKVASNWGRPGIINARGIRASIVCTQW